MAIDKFKIYGRHQIVDESLFDDLFKLNKDFYSKDVLRENGFQKLAYEKNQDTLSLIKYKKEVVGYISYIVIDKDKYINIINAEEADLDYKEEQILNYDINNENYLIIDSIVIDVKYDNKKIVDLFDKAILKYINRKKKEGYIIEDIIAIGVNSFEKTVLDNSILKNKKNLKDKNVLYSYKKIEG